MTTANRSLRLRLARQRHALIEGALPVKGTHYPVGALLRTNAPIDRDLFELGRGKPVTVAESGPGWVTLTHPKIASVGPFRAQYFITEEEYANQFEQRWGRPNSDALANLVTEWRQARAAFLATDSTTPREQRIEALLRLSDAEDALFKGAGE